jgi:hypothetical protein
MVVDFVLKDPREKSELDDETSSHVDLFDKSSEAPGKTQQENFASVQRQIRNSLFVVNPTITAIVDLFHKFEHFRLVELDSVLNTREPYELRPLRSLILQRLEKAHEALMTS